MTSREKMQMLEEGISSAVSNLGKKIAGSGLAKEVRKKAMAAGKKGAEIAADVAAARKTVSAPRRVVGGFIAHNPKTAVGIAAAGTAGAAYGAKKALSKNKEE